LKKALLVLTAMIAALLMTGAATASASTFYTYAGYENLGHPPYVPPVGGEAYTVIDLKSTIFNWGHAAAWIGVDNGAGCPSGGCTNAAWLQAGIFNVGLGPELYIEEKVYGQPGPTLLLQTPASYNTDYTFYIYHLGNGQWEAYAGGYDSGALTLGGTMIDTQDTTEDLSDTLHYTDEIDAVFSSMYPNGTSVLSQNVTNPTYDEITHVTSNGFEAIQYSYNGSCYPNRCNLPPPGTP
jgi:hypothetical protein